MPYTKPVILCFKIVLYPFEEIKKPVGICKRRAHVSRLKFAIISAPPKKALEIRHRNDNMHVPHVCIVHCSASKRANAPQLIACKAPDAWAWF